MKLSLGEQARDTLNGFAGAITARTEYVTGCIYVLLEALDGEGNPIEHWTDEKRVEAIEKEDAEPELVDKLPPLDIVSRGEHSPAIDLARQQVANDSEPVEKKDDPVEKKLVSNTYEELKERQLRLRVRENLTLFLY